MLYLLAHTRLIRVIFGLILVVWVIHRIVGNVLRLLGVLEVNILVVQLVQDLLCRQIIPFSWLFSFLA